MFTINNNIEEILKIDQYNNVGLFLFQNVDKGPKIFDSYFKSNKQS
jgi:hypothetical protein